MARKGPAKKFKPIPDIIYKSSTISKFINSLMYDGKKSIAESLFYHSFKIIRERTNSDPLKIFEEAFKNIQPSVEVKSKRVGGATYQVPIEVRSMRRQTLAIRWIINAAKKRKGKSMPLKLASEIIDAKNNKGGAAKKKEDTIKMAESNRAFAHYRW